MLDFNAAFQKIILKSKICTMFRAAKWYGERSDKNKQGVW